MNKTTTMFAALTMILAAHQDTGGLNQAFSVEPMIDKDIAEFARHMRPMNEDAPGPDDSALANDLIDLQFGHECLGMFMVIGGGEAVIGHIVAVCTSTGEPVRAWWAV